MRAAAVALVSLTLAGCETFGAFRKQGPTVPPPPIVCPASLTAEIADEPLAPDGVDVSALPPGVAAWWFGELLPWARGNTQRLDRAKAWCSKKANP
jgi:hypothetical protein